MYVVARCSQRSNGNLRYRGPHVSPPSCFHNVISQKEKLLLAYFAQDDIIVQEPPNR